MPSTRAAPAAAASPPEAAPPNPDALLRLEGVSKAYRSARETTPVLDGVDLAVTRGEIVCLAGPSGSGKSTLVSLVAGLLVPDAGRVLFDGRDLAAMSDRRRAGLRARRIGVVMQSGNLVPFLTAAENVMLAGRFARRGVPASRAVELLETVGLGDRADHLPRRLSGGEAMRAALAVALVNSPDLLLADEVVGQLDTTSSMGVMTTLERACAERGLSVLLVTHSQSVARRGDRVLRLREGRLQP